MAKRFSLKRENHFLAVLSPIALSPYTAQMFLAASAAFVPLLNSKRRICWKCYNFPTYTTFSSVRDSTHYLQMTKLQNVYSSKIIELQIKNDNRYINPSLPEYQHAKQNRYGIMHQPNILYIYIYIYIYIIRLQTATLSDLSCKHMTVVK